MRKHMTAEEAFRRLADGLGHQGIETFFEILVQRLAHILDVDGVLIAEVDAEGMRATSLAVWAEGSLQPGQAFSLSGSSCEAVLKGVPCHVPRDVRSYFPDDACLPALRAESYLGLPLLAADGHVMGLLAVIATRPMQVDGIEQEVLRIAAIQASAELGRLLIERALTCSEASARESERRLDTLMDHLPGMAYRCRNDRDWTMIFLSRGAKELTGYEAEALEDSRVRSYGDLIYEADRERVFGEVQAAVARHHPFKVVYRLNIAGGGVRWMWEQGQALFDEAGEVVCLEGFVTDITERHEAQRIQQAVLRVATTVTAHLGDDYFHELVRSLVQILEADAGFVATLNHSDDGATTLTTQALVVDGESRPAFTYALAESRCERVIEEQECLTRAGDTIPLPGSAPDDAPAQAWIGRRLDNAAGEPIGVMMVLYRDPLEDDNFATSVLRILGTGAAAELERRRNHQRMAQLAYLDATTGLPNRLSFMEQLSDWRERAEREQTFMAVLFLDLRRFKEINDTHGHQIGDQLLVTVSRRLQKATRRGEYLARLSGDEFAMLVSGRDEAVMFEALERMHDAISRPIFHGHREFRLEVSIGTAQYPRDALSTDELFKSASIALFHAKQREDGVCRFEDSMTQALYHRQAMTDRFLAALHDGGLALHYQPQFDLVTGKLIGAEALCRWHDAEWGWVSPGDFIPLAEERGLIGQLGDWVLVEACRQLSAWQKQGLQLPGRLSINVSAQQFDDPDLAERITRRLGGVPATAIALELTESDFMRDPEQAVAITHALKHSGFALSIDDFGTGYSSLAYLRRFAADTLKIDMSFVREMLHSHHDRAIVSTIIAMARTLGMKTVAEGVEGPEQVEALRQMGCDQAQGFHFGRPVDEKAFVAAWRTAMKEVPQAEPGCAD